MRAPSQRRARAVRAFVLIETKPGEALGVATRLAKIPGVVGAWACTGPYDVIAHVEAINMKSIGRMVANTLQKVAGIERTITCVTI
jgi:DNA-binding Lrp family transcriptional regulator